ncbi:MAG: SagB family peptide dehydrogenase [Thermoleophilaceae bacterium]|nr:SagB family peptide dehydrogenase [Thermoleophilaceae bacterium]
MTEPRDFEILTPLVAGSIAWSDNARARTAIDLGDRVVELEGDDVARVLSGCDGRTTVSELLAANGEGARELIEALFEVGALVDGADAWQIFHRQGSLGTALGTAASDETVVGLQRRRYRPDLNSADVVALEPVDSSVLELTRTRSSSTADTPFCDPDFAQLSAMLAAIYTVRESGNGTKRGGNPSAGALYPLVIHLVLRRSVGELSPGLWWLDPFAGTLHRLGDADGAEAMFIPEPGCDKLLERASPLIFISADISGPARKYGARGYRYALIESGAAMQSAYLAATELGVPLRAVGGIDDVRVPEFLGLPDSAVALLALILG